jgi:Reverse transcriptase (RNA-dependent DNA polymerase)/Aspartyl protease
LSFPEPLDLCNIAFLDTLDSDPVPKGTIRNIRSPSVTIRVFLVGHKSQNKISARALLDSGAEGMIINSSFAARHKLTLRTLKAPLPVKNVDGSLNSSGPIRFTTIQNIRIQDNKHSFHQERSEFYVTTVGTHDIILGTDWLKAHNPELDWSRSRIAFTRCPPSCSQSTQPLIIQQPASNHPTVFISNIEPDPLPVSSIVHQQRAAHLFFIHHELLKYNKPVTIHAKTTHSTTLRNEMQPNPTLLQIPAQFQQYKKVFSEQASHRLPQHQPWDHAIDLKPNATLKKCGIYRLTPAEHLALKEYIHDHLAKGYIRPSKSPMASPFFFVAKQGKGLRPVQDYRNLNDITVKNATPLLLIPELIDKLQGSRYFTKFDVRWGYNNIRIKKGDEWKATFKCSLGLFEPLVMTFGLCNAPATFQTFMNSIFSDLLDQGHLVIYLDDILVFYDSLASLHDLTHEILARLQKYDLYLKPEKCSFDQLSIEYLGVIISHGHVKMDPVKVSGITKWPTPKKT